jgi:hypothetical protein
MRTSWSGRLPVTQENAGSSPVVGAGYVAQLVRVLGCGPKDADSNSVVPPREIG